MPWSSFESADDGFAARARARFTAHRHHVLATVAADGRPRQWGTEVGFHQGEMWIGMPADTAKCRDLGRDPRCSVHCAPIDVDMVDGDTVVEAVARLLDDTESVAWIAEATGQPGPAGARVALLEPTRVRLVTVEGDELVTRAWSPTSGLVEHRRR